MTISVSFTGNVGRDGEIRTVNGTDVLNFSVGVRNGSKRDAGTEWFRVGVWGQRANFLAQHAKKGAKVYVIGELEIGSYDGKPQYNVRAWDVDPFCGGRRDESASDVPESKGFKHPAPAGDFDDDGGIPF